MDSIRTEHGYVRVLAAMIDTTIPNPTSGQAKSSVPVMSSVGVFDQFISDSFGPEK